MRRLTAEMLQPIVESVHNVICTEAEVTDQRLVSVVLVVEIDEKEGSTRGYTVAHVDGFEALEQILCNATKQILSGELDKLEFRPTGRKH